MQILRAQGVVTCHKKWIVVNTGDMQKEGYDNIITWKEFKLVIERFWLKVNPSAWLEKARQKMTDELHGDIVKRFPKWPTVQQKSQEAEIKFDKKDYYDVNDITVYWTAVGFVKIRDVREAQRKYYTECKSDCVMLKVLKLNHTNARKIETLCITDFDGAKAVADRNGEKATKMITWQEL